VIYSVTKDALMAVLNSVHGEGWNRQAPITAATPPPVQEEQVAPITATMPPPIQEGQVTPITAATPSLVQEEQRAQETAVADDGDGQTIIAGEDIDLNIQLLFLSIVRLVLILNCNLKIRSQTIH
jgi:hypothetical protein